jgi:hypothetical protein
MPETEERRTMTKFTFKNLSEWKMAELRQFIKSYDLGVKGRSKQQIVTQIQRALSPAECDKLITKFKMREQELGSMNPTIKFDSIEGQIQNLKRTFADIEADFNLCKD